MLFLNTEMFWNLLWLIPLFLVLSYIVAARSAAVRRLLFKNEDRAAAFLNLHKGKRRIRAVLFFCAIVFAVAAAAGPAWGQRILPDAGPGHDLLILFDVSRSMLSDDVKPDRLAQGKWLVRELVRSNPADRFGLIAFAGNAFLLCPLTIDKTSFLQLSDALDTDTIPLGGTDLQTALETAIRAFEGAQGNHKAVIVITDGDELTGKAEGTVEKLAAAGIPLFIAGIGDPANPSVIRIKQQDGTSTILKDSEGNTVKSALNEPLLSSLAQKTRGMYIRSTSADPGLAELNSAIARLDRRKGDKSMLSITRPIERPGFLFSLSLLFLIMALCLSETKKTAKVEKAVDKQILLLFTSILLFGFSMPLSAQAPAAPQTEDTAKEPVVLQPEKGKDPATFWFNAGYKAQTENKEDAAREAYEKAIGSGKEPAVRAGSFQNLGVMKHLNARKSLGEANGMLKQQKLDDAQKKVETAISELNEAEEHYRESLRYSAQLGTSGSVTKNQQLLLRERKDAEELKKQIEELKKKQEQAQKQAQQALKDQQNKQNQQQNKQDQQKQQQNKQDQKQDQQNKQDQKQNQPQNSAEKAAQSARELSDQAQKLSQDQMKQQADQAEKELNQAMSEQKKGNEKKAEEHLKKAVQALGGDEQKKQDQKKDQQGQDRKDKQDQQGHDQKKDQSSQKELPKQPRKQQGGNAEKPQDRSIDPEQAKSILNAMERDEKELRDLLKEMQKKNAPQREPSKNW